MTTEPRGRINKGFTAVIGGSRLLIVDGAAPAVEFELAPPVEETWSMERVIITMSAVAMKALVFGGSVALVNGIKFTQERAGVEIEDFLDGETIKKNVDFGLLGGVDNIIQLLPAEDLLTMRWTLGRAGFPLILRGNDDERIVMTVQDDLTTIGLASLDMIGQGIIIA